MGPEISSSFGLEVKHLHESAESLAAVTLSCLDEVTVTQKMPYFCGFHNSTSHEFWQHNFHVSGFWVETNQQWPPKNELKLRIFVLFLAELLIPRWEEIISSFCFLCGGLSRGIFSPLLSSAGCSLRPYSLLTRSLRLNNRAALQTAKHYFPLIPDWWISCCHRSVFQCTLCYF